MEAVTAERATSLSARRILAGETDPSKRRTALASTSRAPTIARVESTWPWSDRRCFSLRSAPPDGSLELEREDAEHLARVLRARAGERILGLDGRGRAWPLRVAAVERDTVQVEPDGAPFEELAPRVRPIEVAVAWPRQQAGEELLDGLVQLGCARLVALVAARSQEWAREWTPARRSRLERRAREACKQARRLWPIELAGPLAFEAWLAEASSTPARVAVLDPRGAESLVSLVARERAAAASHAVLALKLAIGPEGGWTVEELDAARRAGAHLARLESYVLRTELAAQAAAAIALQ